MSNLNSRNGFLLCFFVSLLLCFSSFSLSCRAGEIDDARQMIYAGQLEQGAQMLSQYVKDHPRDKSKTPEALLLLGQVLDRLADLFSERAEMACYWGRGTAQSPECMQSQADKLNAIYGAGAFQPMTNIAFIPYTGIHYREIINRFSGSDEAAEAEFQLLLKNLVGHPDVVLPRVKKFMESHKSGDVGRKALLLWARVNEDIWYIHRDWSWVLFNERVSPEDLMIRAEPYRQEALRTYEKLISKYGGTFEGQEAKKELGLLKAQQYDNVTYSILADSVGGTPEKWGSRIPAPKLKATQRGVGEPGWNRPSGTSAPAEASETAQPEEKKKSTPKRWQ
jgi:hypothetical protein